MLGCPSHRRQKMLSALTCSQTSLGIPAAAAEICCRASGGCLVKNLERKEPQKSLAATETQISDADPNWRADTPAHGWRICLELPDGT